MRTFTCSECGKTYESAWSEAERDAEQRELWGELKPEERAVVCDKCFKRLMGLLPKPANA